MERPEEIGWMTYRGKTYISLDDLIEFLDGQTTKYSHHNLAWSAAMSMYGLFVGVAKKIDMYNKAQRDAGHLDK